MSDNYEQPVEPMSRAEDILRGNTSTVPMSRVEDLLKQLIEGGGGGGSTVTITTDYQAGTKIATLTIDGTDYNVYIPEPIDIEANTIDPATEALNTIKIGNTVYSLPSGVVYSTNEFDTGRKWYDGRTIYGRVFTGSNITPNRFRFTTEITGSNVEIVHLEGICQDTNNHLYPMNYYGNSTWFAGVKFEPNNGGIIELGNNMYLNSFKIIVEYVKPTS